MALPQCAGQLQCRDVAENRSAKGRSVDCRGGLDNHGGGQKGLRWIRRLPSAPAVRQSVHHYYFFSEAVSVEQNPWIWEMFHLVCQESSKAKAKVKKSTLFVSAT